MAQDPIERAARALFEYEPGPYGDCVEWAVEQDFGWRSYVPMVKLVLAAIREPSDEVILAGTKDIAKRSRTDFVLVYPLVKDAWPVMVDTLLAKGGDE